MFYDLEEFFIIKSELKSTINRPLYRDERHDKSRGRASKCLAYVFLLLFHSLLTADITNQS